MKKSPKPERVVGRAAIEQVRKGTASAHRAVVLTTQVGERLLLQRIGGNPFMDPETRSLVGHDVEVEGFRLHDIFRFTQAKPLDAEPALAGGAPALAAASSPDD